MKNTITNLTKSESEILTTIVEFCERYNAWDYYIYLNDALHIRSPIDSYKDLPKDLKGIIDKGFIKEIKKGAVISLTNKGIDFANNQ